MVALLLFAMGMPMALAQKAPLSSYDTTMRVYGCAGGAVVNAAYINMADGLSLAVIGVERDGYDGLMVLEIAISASGARYVSRSDPRHVWWTRGETAFLLEGEDGKEETVLEHCLAETP